MVTEQDHSRPVEVVTVNGKTTVFPASPSTAGRNYFLSSLDLFWQDLHYNQRLLFYRSAAADAAQALKQSLSEVLVHYYPWCGRIAVGDHRQIDEYGRRLVIDCNDAGVEFVEASIDYPIAKLAEQGFQMMPWFEQLCQKVDHCGDSLYKSPLLSVQATGFSDGGLALGVTHSHVVADGEALWNFLVGWGECARGLAPSLTVQPLHDRQRLALKGPPSEEKSKGFTLTLEINPEDYQNILEEEEDPKLPAEKAEDGSTAQCLFEISGEALKKLKQEAGGAYSSYEVLCAHFWQRATAARQLPAETAATFSVLANGRSRLSPPLPSSYFGNVITLRVVGAPAAKIRSESLQQTAARVHEASTLAAKSTEALVHWLELRGNRLLPYYRPVGKGMMVASSPRFPAYSVDFGWGAPCAVRSAKVPGNGEMVVFGGRPGSSPGDVEICFALTPPAMRRLLVDPAFQATTPCPPIFDC